MRQLFAMTALPLIAILAAACTGSAGSSSQDTAALPGTAWTVTSVDAAPTDAAAPPTMTFAANGTVSGTTGCNTYNGTYKLDGATIAIGQLSQTLMLCAGAVGEQETAFSAALQGATSWAIGADGNLTLGGAGDIAAKPASRY